MIRRVRAPVMVLSLMLFLVAVPCAWAKVNVTFEPAGAVPGASVRAWSGIMLFESIRPRTVDVFLRPAEAGPVASVMDPRLVPLGQLVADRDNYGWISFTVPEVAPGIYHTFVHCAGCGGSDGTLLGVGSFTVLPPGTEESVQNRPPEMLLAAGAVGFVAFVLTIVGGRLARRRSGPLLERLFIGPHTPGHAG